MFFVPESKNTSALLPTMWDRGTKPNGTPPEEAERLKELVVYLSALAIKNVIDHTEASVGLAHYCEKNECDKCELKPNMASCLRRKAKICMGISTTFSGKKRFALEKISLDLMAEASAKVPNLAIL